jgi:YidC/Oxa1 family membrane protein insertase
MGIESLGISIIVFTVIIRTLMLPLAFQQQKQMKEMAKIQPELKAIQEKYKNRKDPDSQRQMQAETGQLYQKHGVHPFGGCLPLIIQMPIIFALFQVLRNVPSYINSIKELFASIATSIANVPGAETILASDTYKSSMSQVKDFIITDQNKVIDLLGKFSSDNWSQLKLDIPSIADAITPYVDKIMDINYFFGINLADKPNLLSIGILIPVLNVVVQFLVSKTSSPTGTDQSGAQGGAQKSMMYTMPLITAIFVIQMPAGLGLYWFASSAFQLVQQFVINRHLHSKDQKA